ncbi:MAG TPA: hypothetical protein VGN80_04700 [Devosiaceae bacterium]|jgi:hypothetical protein|nr:hypothetical protein [Devosiaceae bacterium]
MKLSSNIGLVGLLTVLALTAAPAQAFELKAGAAAKLRPTKVDLGIISPVDHLCPGAAKLTVWVHTNKPGTLDILLVRKGGQVAGPFAVTTSEGAAGAVIGSYSQAMQIVHPIDAEYRVVIPGSSVASNWVPLKADC